MRKMNKWENEQMGKVGYMSVQYYGVEFLIDTNNKLTFIFCTVTFVTVVTATLLLSLFIHAAYLRIYP